MRKADIKTNFSCNNNCLFCVQGDKRHRYKDKSTEKVKKILEDARKNHEMVVFTGGEITIREDLPELVSYAKKIGFSRIQLQTNGRRFAYKRYCETLIESGANEFGLALHGATAETHDSLTQAEGSFMQTTRGIKNLTSMGQKVIMNSVLTKPGYRSFPDLADLFIELGVHQYQFAFIHINEIIKNDPEKIDKIVPKKSEVIPFVKKGLQKGIDAGLIVMTEAIPFCFMEGFENYIAEYGKIPKGAVYDAELKVNNYEDYRKTRGKKKAEKCKKCKYFNICEGPWKEYPEIFGWDEFNPIID